MSYLARGPASAGIDGYRSPDHLKIAVYFHCGGLNLYPAP